MRPPAIIFIALALLASCVHPEAHSTRTPHPSDAVEISPVPEALAARTNVQLTTRNAVRLANELIETKQQSLLGTYKLTYYWMAHESKRGAKNTTIYTPSCKPIAKVSKNYARRLAMEGTGRLRDGRTVNVARHCNCDFSPCFFVPGNRWGHGVLSRPLSPFRSIAVDSDHIPYGTKVYIAELDGLTMPGAPPYGGFVHDGCVTADDTGGGVKGRQVDFFTARWGHYKALFGRHKLTSVTVYDGAELCKGDRQVERAQRNSI